MINPLGTHRAALIGRNLHTWTKYHGFDPEVGFGAVSGAGSTANGSGSAAINAIDLRDGDDDRPMDYERIPATMAVRQNRPYHGKFRICIAGGDHQEIAASAIPIVGPPRGVDPDDPSKDSKNPGDKAPGCWIAPSHSFQGRLSRYPHVEADDYSK